MLDVKSDWTDIGEPDADTVAKLNEIFAPKTPEVRDAAYYRRKWVEAARSGKYEQAHGQLRKHNAFCILGLACEVVREDFGFFWDKNDCFRLADDDESEEYDCEIPEQVAEIFGLVSDDAWYEKSDDHTSSLPGENDNGTSLAELADIIESEPPGLFK